MRIIAGEFRSRALVTPEDQTTRPTMDRARESLFNVLSNLMSFENILVLDLFAGSGALAFEALSRGAARATLLDTSPKAIRAIEQNSHALKVEDRVTIVRKDASNFLEKPASRDSYDLILADPPYEKTGKNGLAESILENDWLTLRGFCVIEHRTTTSLAPIPRGRIVRELKAGEACFTIFTHATV